MKKKKILGSQRALQFGGSPVFKHNARIYNCIASYIDRVRFFQECMYLLIMWMWHWILCTKTSHC